MKNRISGYKLALVFLGFIIGSCNDDNEKQNTTIRAELKGRAQKGPFIVGSNILVSELTSSLQQTGRTFTAQINDNSGFFELSNIELPSNYVQFSATGFYFDEVKGAISLAALTLHSYSDISDGENVNVNIMTHLEKSRVEFLVKQNKTFTEAKKTAQADVLAFFGFSNGDIDHSESLDISANSEGNAVLLAISVILQGNRTVGDLSELIANISSSIRDGSNVNADNIRSDLRVSAKQLDLAAIRSNLVKRYQDLGVSANIPGFEKYVNDFLKFTGKTPALSLIQVTDIHSNSAAITAYVNANSLSTNVSIEYGTTITYDKTMAVTSISSGSDTQTATSLADLSPGTTYHFRIVATNSKGATTSPDMTFTTLGSLPIVNTTEPTMITSTTSMLNGSVNANDLATTVIFEYGTTPAYGETIVAIQNPLMGNDTKSVNANLAGLVTGMTYHYRVTAQNALGTITGQDQSFTPTYTVGGSELGGIVFYLFQPGDAGFVNGEIHGLVAAPDDQGAAMPWYNGTYVTTGATGTGVGTGSANTTAIINGQGDAGVYGAKVCRDYRGGGYNDWYLPSRDELAILYANRLKIGGFDYQFIYWSSTETDDHGACYRDFRNEYEFCGFWKINIAKIRAIRAF